MKKPHDFKCWQCEDTGRVATQRYFPATKYQPAGTLLSEAPCPRCSPKPSAEAAR